MVSEQHLVNVRHCMLGARDIKPNKTQSSPLRSLEFGGREWHGEKKKEIS